jgi:hypothetical protein
LSVDRSIVFAIDQSSGLISRSRVRVERFSSLCPPRPQRRGTAWVVARSLFLGLSLALFAPPLVAQVTVADPLQRFPRGGGFAFYDEVRGRVTVAGGKSDNGWVLRQTWHDATGTSEELVVQFEGEAQITLPVRFPARAFGCTAPGWPGRSAPLLFGGQNPDGSLSDETYQWNGSRGTFDAVSPGRGPSPRKLAAMATQPDGSVLLFGGFDGGLRDDTWLYSQGRWQQLSPATTPPKRLGHAMAYARIDQRVLLYGGEGDRGVLDDVWSFDGSDWSYAGQGPPARMGHVMAWDEARGRLVCYGNSAGSSVPWSSGDTWEWRGGWRPAPDHAAVCASHVVFDCRRRRVLAFGGLAVRSALGFIAPARNHLAVIDAAGWTGIGIANGVAAPPIPPVMPYAMSAFDPRRDRITVFGGEAHDGSVLGATWEVREALWQERVVTMATPGPRRRGVMVHSPADGVHYLFGGENAVFVWPADLWRFDGSTWSIVPASGRRPAPRVDPAMAYDPRGVLVLHGGRDANNLVLADHWEFDVGSATWRQLAGSAPARAQHAMAFDTARNRLVLQGGIDAGENTVGDTFEFDGSAWQLNASAGGPAAARPRMVYDVARRRMVSVARPNGRNGTFEYGGATWIHHATGFTEANPLVYDSVRGQVVALITGLDGILMGWDGTDWTASWRQPPVLTGRQGHTLTLDSLFTGSAVMFGGRHGNALTEHQVRYDGRTWSLELPPVAPSARTDHAACYSVVDQCHVLNGGRSAQGVQRDTWTLDRNGRWTDETLGGPHIGAREHHAMCYHAAPGYVLLFGGALQGTPSNHTATWQRATGWTLLNLPPVPPREGHAMAYHALTQRTVMFGGQDGGVLADTWLYEHGVGWRQATPRHSPPARRDHTMVYDPSRGRVLLFGGHDRTRPFTDQWLWDGADWRELTIDAGGPLPSDGQACFDTVRQRMVIHSGTAGALQLWANVDTNGVGDVANPLPLRQLTQPVTGEVFQVQWPYPMGSMLLWYGPDAGPLSDLSSCSTQTLYVYPVYPLPAAAPAFGLPIPEDPSLAGLLLTLQGFTFDQTSCLRLTDALNVVIQGR